MLFWGSISEVLVFLMAFNKDLNCNFLKIDLNAIYYLLFIYLE